MAIVVYSLCAATALACAVLLFRSYSSSRFRFLLWSSVCFFGLALANIVLVIDLVILPAVDYSIIRHAITLASLVVFIYSLIWDTRSS